MPNCAHHRRAQGCYRACYRFQVEYPQIFQATATPGEQNGVCADLIGALQRVNHLWFSVRALYLGRNQNDFEQWIPALPDRQHIPYRGAAGGGHHRDTLGFCRQGLFATRLEQPLCLQLYFQGVKGLAQSAFTGRLHVIHDHLEIAAPLIQAHTTAQVNLLAVAWLHLHVAIAIDEHGAAYLSLIVFQREVPVAGSGSGKVGQFAGDPYLVEVIFQGHACTAIQRADAEDPLAVFGVGGCVLLLTRCGRATAPGARVGENAGST